MTPEPTSYVTFEVFVDDDRYAVPTLYLISAPDPATAQEITQRMLDESHHHRGAELCLAGERLAGLGSFAVGRLSDACASAQ